jgi:N-carbamoyl-L-amino-acid hydrolase
MDARHDPGLAAAATALRVEEIARSDGGVGTVGGMTFEPGIPTAVPGKVSMLVDLRHREAGALARMLESAREAVHASAAERGCDVAEEPIWRIEPISFDPQLVGLAREACEKVTGTGYELSSGALHDAASMALHLPTAMIFSPSIGGVSHAPEEDTAERDLAAAIDAFGALANRRLA